MPIQSGERFFADEGLGSVSATVATLPNGCNLGEERINAGIRYRLCYNGGTAAIAQGKVASPVPIANQTIGTVCVSTTSRSFHHMGAVVAVNTSVSAGAYFWGAYKGIVGGMVGDAASLPTGSLICVGDSGAITLFPAGSTATGWIPVGFVITSVSNGGTATGNCFIDIP